MNEHGEALVYPFDLARERLGNSEQSHYIYKYLNDIKARTYVFEDNYIDKDYLIDYSKFYARSFNIDKKFTKRLHFFSEPFSEEDFKQVLLKSNKKRLKKFEDSYLGFVVIKPIEDSQGNPLIGRTILKTYSADIKDEHRYYLTGTHHVSLFGIPLKIESLPFQTQDTAVGACATTACWISLHPLSDLFGIQKSSPFEVTEMSVSFPSLDRNFPSTGLTLYQMKSYYNSIGLETEFIDPEIIQKSKEYTFSDDVIADAVRAYTNMKLPIIASLAMKKEKEENAYDYHAVVISGYRYKQGILKELYVHDDQIGPYSRVKPNGKFNKWKNEWIMKGYSEVFVQKLLIPIYPKIRLNFGFIYQAFLEYKRKLETLVTSKTLDEKLTPELYLMEVRQYKKFLWEHFFEKKEETLCKPFPWFLWVIRVHFRGIPIMDYVYDGTSVFPKELCSMIFKY